MFFITLSFLVEGLISNKLFIVMFLDNVSLYDFLSKYNVYYHYYKTGLVDRFSNIF